MKAKWRVFPFGLRVIKTALAVMISVLLVGFFTDEPLALFYAAFGALIAMDTTITNSLEQGLTQLVGVLAGTVFSYLFMLAFPNVTPALLAGFGVLLLIMLCNIIKMPFTVTLSCLIFLSACLTPTDDVLLDSLLRLRNTSIGIFIALAINAAIRPYNNKKRILELLSDLRKILPKALHQIVVHERFPEFQDSVVLLRSIDRELTLYHSQRLFHRRNDEEALLRGCYRLAERMVQELEAICGMDSLGNLSESNAAAMRQLGMELPEIRERKCTLDDTIVMNYHMEKLLSAYQYLTELMATAKKSDE